MSIEDKSRVMFEDWVTAPPFEHDIGRFPQRCDKTAWPGQYVDIHVQFAWEAWEESRKSNSSK